MATYAVTSGAVGAALGAGVDADPVVRLDPAVTGRSAALFLLRLLRPLVEIEDHPAPPHRWARVRAKEAQMAEMQVWET
jgi:hypothetical protein